MKYYKITKRGITRILNTDDYNEGVLKENFYLEENEVIKTRYMIQDQDRVSLYLEMYTNSNRPLTMSAYLKMKGGYLTNNVDIILDNFKYNTLDEVHKHAEDLVFNKDFIFSRDKEIHVLEENVHYIEITEKEYKDNKIKESFK